MAFYVGQRVVCVDATARYKRVGDPTWPLHLNAVYTVRGFASETGEPCVLLDEICEENKRDSGYFEYRFKPAVERKTDISIFTAMLTPKRQSVDA